MKTRSQHSKLSRVSRNKTKKSNQSSAKATTTFEATTTPSTRKANRRQLQNNQKEELDSQQKKLDPLSDLENSQNDDPRCVTPEKYDSEDDYDNDNTSGSEIVNDEEEKVFEEMEREMEEQFQERADHKEKQQVSSTFLSDDLQKEQNPADDDETEGIMKSEKKVNDSELYEQFMLLLQKAAVCSKFISENLAELLDTDGQNDPMPTENKKRKPGRKNSASKRRKKGSRILAQMIAEDMENRAASGPKTKFAQPPNLANGCQLKEYQLEGLQWLAALYQNGVSGILADEMGLGKTMQSIAMIAYLIDKQVPGPFLIVAPLATLPNWVREFQKWLPNQPVIRYHGTAPEREDMLQGPLRHENRHKEDFPIIITSYECLMRDRAKLDKLSPFEYLIIDEGHRLKHHRCALMLALKKIKSANRLLLTGTPIQNTLKELWSLLNFVNPDIFDDISLFETLFGFRNIGQNVAGATTEEEVLMKERNNRTVTMLHEILRPFLLRRVKRDVLAEMPPKKEVIVYSGVSKLQAAYAALIEDGTLRETLIQQGIDDGRRLSQTNKNMNHRKNINHPFLFGEPIDPETGMHMGSAYPHLLLRASGKFALLDRMLTRLHKDGHQVLVFSQMTRILDIMEDYLCFRGWKYCRIDGSTKIDDRQKEMDAFNAEMTKGAEKTRNKADDRNFVFLLSTRAGGVGINLTAADTCIIFDSDWNPHADSQAMDRCHRIGQTLPVAVYRLLTVNSVDIEMMEKQISKKKLERMTIVGGDFRKACSRSRGKIKPEQLCTLLQSDVKDLNAKGGGAQGADVENIQIDDKEFNLIMDRERLFATGSDAIPTEGKMYDIIDAASGDFLDQFDK